MIVIDVGCAKWGGDESIPYLVETFKPWMLIGFDPGAEPFAGTDGDTIINVFKEAAWTYDGTIGFRVAGLGGQVDGSQRATTPCIDLARFVNELPDEEIVLKMDAEGAEYTVLPHICATDADLRLKMAIIEWHCEVCGLGGNGRHRDNCTVDRAWWVQRRNDVEDQMRCPTEEWNL